jgi:putative transposase
VKDTYTEIYFHFVWATKGREAMITPAVQTVLYPYILGVCRDRGIHVYALGGMYDHVHLACNLTTTLTVADLVKQIKGGAAHLVNHLPDEMASLRWQPGYGALTFTVRDLKRIISYVDHQAQHHCDNTLLPKLERCSEPDVPSSSPVGTS